MRRTMLAGAALAGALIMPTATGAAAKPHKPLAKTRFETSRPGEAKLTLTASAPGTDWGKDGHESAVLSVRIDGRQDTSVVTFNGARPLEYRLALGHVGAGEHTVVVTFDRDKSPAAVTGATVAGLRASMVPEGDLVARYAPILYGRDLPEITGRFENNHTDVPLLAYHTSTPDRQGNRTIEYTTIWSNEDGGTNTPALMARWGRTTDIEWIYRVVVDADGRRVSDAYQAANHETKAFDGAREADHPLLQTTTANNNTSAVTDPARSSGYRFFLDTADTLPAGRAREADMDAHPWSYPVMAKEMLREGKLESAPSPDTPEMSDQRNYLFTEIKKTTSYPSAPASGTWVGVALEVKRKGDARWYASSHQVPDWSIQRDDPAATTIELPPGSTPADVEAIKAVAVPVARTTPSPAPAPTDYTITVTGLKRGFFLGQDLLPLPAFVRWLGSQTLSPTRPEAVIWHRPAGTAPTSPP